MMHTISGHDERMSRQTSIPLPSGRRTSSTATSGFVRGNLAMASGRCGLAHDLKVVGGLDERTEPRAHYLVIVKEKDTSTADP